MSATRDRRCTATLAALRSPEGTEDVTLDPPQRCTRAPHPNDPWHAVELRLGSGEWARLTWRDG